MNVQRCYLANLTCTSQSLALGSQECKHHLLHVDILCHETLLVSSGTVFSIQPKQVIAWIEDEDEPPFAKAPERKEEKKGCTWNLKASSRFLVYLILATVRWLDMGILLLYSFLKENWHRKSTPSYFRKRSNVGCGEGAGCWNATWAKNIVNRGCWIVVAGPKCRCRNTLSVIVAFDQGSNLPPLPGSSWGSSCWFSTVVTTLGRRARNFTTLQRLSSYLLQKGWPEQLQEKWSWTWNSCSLLNHAICFLWASSLGNLT
jgi:hypothetical protein